MVGAVTENRGLLEQISLLKREKGGLMNQVNKLKDELFNQKEYVNELEDIKKILWMMNFSSVVLDQILSMSKTTSGHEGLGFTRRNSGIEFATPVNTVHNSHQVDRMKTILEVDEESVFTIRNGDTFGGNAHYT